jgi:hypothetical protein
VHSLCLLNAHLAELYRTPQSFCLQLCLAYIALPPEVFNNLQGLPRVDDFSYCAHLACLCLNPQSSEVLQCTGIQRPQYSITPSWHETTKNLSSLKSKQLLQMQTYNIHSQHIKNTQRHSFNTEIMQEKLLLCIKWKMPVLQGCS